MMDPWEHEDRSSFGDGSQSPWRPLRNRDHDQLLIKRWNLFLGDNREWKKQIHDGNGGGTPQENRIDCNVECTGKLVAKAKPKRTSMPTSSSSTVTLPYHQRDWIDVEPGSAPQELFWSVKKHDHIGLTRSFSGQYEDGWITCKKGGPETSFQYCVDAYSSCTFEQADTILYLRAVQGHSGGNQIDPALQDNVLLPSDFAEYICHVVRSHDTHSVIQSALIPGGKNVKEGMHAVFFTAVNPMYIDHYREREHDVTKPRIAVYKHNWKIHQNIMYWCILRVAQRRGLQLYQTRPDAIILDHTLSAVCIEKVVIRKSGEEMPSKTYQSSTVPKRIVLKPNLHYERQDTTSFDARTSFDHSFKHNKKCHFGAYNKSCRGEIIFWIQGLLRSAVQEHDHIRREAVQKIDSPVRDTPEWRSVESRPEAKSRVQSVQRAVEGYDQQHGKHGVLQDLRDHSQNTVLQLYDVLDKKNCKLY